MPENSKSLAGSATETAPEALSGDMIGTVNVLEAKPHRRYVDSIIGIPRQVQVLPFTRKMLFGGQQPIIKLIHSFAVPIGPHE